MVIIGVTSPVHGQAGTTTLALLSAALLAGIQKKKVLLLHASVCSSTFFSYLGLDGLKDITSTPSQLYTMIRERQVSPVDARTYCVPLLPDKMLLDVYGNNLEGESNEVMREVQDFLMKNREYDVVVIDLDLPSSSPRYIELAGKCTTIVCAITQSANVDNRLALVKDSLLPSKHVAENRVIYACNHYSAKVGNTGSLQKKLKVKQDGFAVIPHTPTIMFLSNGGNLSKLLDATTKNLEPDVHHNLIAYTRKLCAKCGYKYFQSSGGIK